MLKEFWTMMGACDNHDGASKGARRQRRWMISVISFMLLQSCFEATVAFQPSVDYNVQTKSTHMIPIGGTTSQHRSRFVAALQSQRSSRVEADDTIIRGNDIPSTPRALRLNKAFKATHSRRGADQLVQDGRVTVNGEVTDGCMIIPYQDVVRLDGVLVGGWEILNGFDQQPIEDLQAESSTPLSAEPSQSMDQYEYVKYWKPRGVISTTDQRIPGNIIDQITTRDGYQPKHRVYPVGRLDKDSSGLILLTSDGRLPNASLRSEYSHSKVYRVQVDHALSLDDVDDLRRGVMITTMSSSDRKRGKPLRARTKPCDVKLVSRSVCLITLQEGRNRQIRKMVGALGYAVLNLERVEFGPIAMNDLDGPGSWKRLNAKELESIREILKNADEGRDVRDYEEW